MHRDIVQKLLDLNQEFYQTFACQFSETRERVQPGVLRAIDVLPNNASVLDLGCGNGRLANELVDRGHTGIYLGLDSSDGLLEIARAASHHSNSIFKQIDVVKKGWSKELPGIFDRIFAFAIFHHIPSEDLRGQVFGEIREIIKPDGILVFSVWNFLESPRLRTRVIPWEKIALDENQVEPGDYLLDWKRGGYGLRYVHSFEDDELIRLARLSGFEVVDSYVSDGEGGKLGSYQMWVPRK
jgi:SAM-dependent methyltransferase